MGILLGLSAAFWWGTSDFLAAGVARAVGTLRALLLTQSFGLIGIGVILCWQGTMLHASPRVWVFMIGIGLTQALSVYLFYRAFEIGKLSLVAPITSGFAVVTAILSLMSGERPARLALAGAALLIIGVLFVTRGQDTPTDEPPDKSTLRGIPEAFAAAIGYGFIFWGLGFVVPTMGPFWPLAILRTIALLCLCMAWLILRPPLPQTINWRAVRLPAFCVAAADTGAWLSFNAGTQRDDVSIVTTLASLYSAVAVFFAWLLWRERLKKSQWLGVAIILLGIVLVGMK